MGNMDYKYGIVIRTVSGATWKSKPMFHTKEHAQQNITDIAGNMPSFFYMECEHSQAWFFTNKVETMEIVRYTVCED